MPTLNRVALTIRTPTTVTPNLWKQPYEPSNLWAAAAWALAFDRQVVSFDASHRQGTVAWCDATRRHPRSKQQRACPAVLSMLVRDHQGIQHCYEKRN